MAHLRIIMYFALSAIAVAAHAEVRVTTEEVAAILTDAGLENVKIEQGGIRAGFPATWSIDRVFDAMPPISGEKTREISGPMRNLATEIAQTGAVFVFVSPENNRVRYRMLWPPILAVILAAGIEDESKYQSEDELFGPLKERFADKLVPPPNLMEHGLVDDYRVGFIYNMDYIAGDWDYDVGDVRRHVAFLLERVAPLFESWTIEILGKDARMISSTGAGQGEQPP